MMKKIFKVAAQSLSIVIIVLSCGALLVLGRSTFGYRALIIPTGSMRPNISVGSLILTHRVPIQSLRVGDVITYISPVNPKMTISHRITQMKSVEGGVTEFVTKGDANSYEDIPIYSSSVEGKVIWHIPNLGGWLLHLKDPFVILPIIYSAGLLVSADELIRLKDYYKRLQPYRLRGFASREPKMPLTQKVGVSVGFCVISIVAVGLLLDYSPASALQPSNQATVNVVLRT